MNYAVSPSQPATLPIANSEQVFPVRRVYCVGRNYADHAVEMGSDPNREPPFFFCKHNDEQSIVAVLPNEIKDLPYPSQTQNLHYEVELVVAIGKDGKNIDVATATSHIFGYAVGLDMTRRDLQNEMKKSVALGKLAKHLTILHRLGSCTRLATQAKSMTATLA